MVAKFQLRAFFFVLIAYPLSLSVADGQTLTTMQNSGDSSNRVDMMFIGDGYLASQLDVEYVDHVNSTVDAFFNQSVDPFPRYKNFFNIHRTNIASNEQGADKPDPDGPQTFVDTALNASYWWGGTERCLYFDTGLANAAVNTAIAAAGGGIDVDMRFGVVNDEKYGGCGGSWGVYSGANSSAKEVAIHEIGHSFANLADEYFYNGTTYTGGELSQVNVTSDPANGKWDRWVGYEDPDQPSIGEIGYYEGGQYHDFGIWRPSDNSKMRALGRPFDAIGRERFIDEIYEEVDPLDDWLDNSTMLNSPAQLWVDSVDADVINVEWFVDGVSYGVLGESVDLADFGLATGTYTIEARAYDSILDFSNTGLSLDWWRLAEDPLRQNISWSVSFVAVPEPSTTAILMASLALAGFRRRRARCSGRVA